ncbi:MAG: SAM-dependent methyltransferase, partial [Candidatus Uhrbacteria bacterium]|nr:SAM-dependent methyltransferase [Candidatus Uhrbacteria bacterium]
MIASSCSLCSSAQLRLVIDLGYHPLGDTFLSKEALNEPETRYPLRVFQCTACGHAFQQFVVPEKDR